MLQLSLGHSNLCFAITPIILALACGTNPVATPSVSVRINEVSSSNHDYMDEIGDTDDWIELYNPNAEAVDLTGYFLSDSHSKRFKVELTEAAVVPGNGLLFLWADGEPSQGPLHVNFKLSSVRDGVCLSNPEGYTLDCVEFGAVPPYTAGTEDTSLARFPDGFGRFEWCNISSPEELNGTACSQPAQ